MSSFGKPILEGAREHNADTNKPLYIDRLGIFGSYVNPKIDPLGDVDVELS